MKSSAARHDARILSERPARLGDHDAVLVDVSESGARLRSEASFRKGEKSLFHWRPVPGGPACEIPVEVLWSGRGLVGLRFATMNARDRAFLRALVRFHRG